MPSISRFMGITIYMYWGEYERPHLHARKAGCVAQISIEDGEIMEGHLPSNADYHRVAAWISIHKKELMEDWRLIRDKKTPKKIKPLS